MHIAAGVCVARIRARYGCINLSGDEERLLQGSLSKGLNGYEPDPLVGI